MQEKKEKQKYTSKHVRNGSLVFDIFNYVFLGAAAIVCLLPIINVLAISFSSSAKASAGLVGLVPLEFNLQSYKYALTKPQFLTSFLTSVKRVILGLVINMTCTVLTAYPLSKSSRELKGRNIYAWFMFITMVFSGGLIPQFMVVNQLNLMNTIWALILPGAVPVFNVIILMNFFKQIPKEIQESAMMDGAGHLRILAQLYLPLSLPSLATITLFYAVGKWGEWYPALVYLQKRRDLYPLQMFLRELLVKQEDMETLLANNVGQDAEAYLLKEIIKYATIIVTTVPILVVYPFLQKYFVKGVLVGSVKG